MARQFILHTTGLLALVIPVFAQLPYYPTRVIPSQNGSAVYLFSPKPSSSQFSLSVLDTVEAVNSTSSARQLLESLPFLSETTLRAFIPIPDEQGLSVLAGNCEAAKDDLELWRFTRNPADNNGTWSTLPLNVADESLTARYLSAGFSFSSTGSIQDASLYVFGGMCPESASPDVSNWTSAATYSNTMLNLAAVSPSDTSSQYEVSLTGSRAPPIPEAGLTITPLISSYSMAAGSNMSQQQNFILLGGHTQTAFINMSQLAIFSLPQESWAFVGVSQPSTSAQRLKSRDVPVVEPRSGHTAILTADGSKIIVLGGWVGNISIAAEPQLAVLELGQGYGGQGDWAWTIPSATEGPFPSGTGIYGHGAVMLSGNVMMVAGGHTIDASVSSKKRQVSEQLRFFNATSMTWTESYSNPNPSGTATNTDNPASSSAGLKPSEKAGLGAGLGLGLAAAIGIAVVWLLYSRKLHARRALREKEIRELALGAERLHTPAPPGDNSNSRYPAIRTASWAGAQENQIEGSGNLFPWAPVVAPGQRELPDDEYDNHELRYTDRTGAHLDVPNQPLGLRKNSNSRNPASYGGFYPHPAAGMPGSVFRIDEEDESSQTGSIKKRGSSQPFNDRNSVVSDPFRDPPGTANSSRLDAAAQERQKEVDGWVEDWQSAAESMTVSRSTSQAHSRTYSNLSHIRSQTAGDSSGRGSPEKSDRTGSNLSDKSIMSASDYSKSIPGTVSRSLSQRSVSAGYALFSGAAAAMGRLGGSRPNENEPEGHGSITRAPSNRSVSLTMEAELRNRGDTFSSGRTPLTAPSPWENQALLNRAPYRRQQDSAAYQTLEWSPRKEKYSRAGSLSGSGRRALNLLGSVKRVFTGTGGVDVNDRVTTLEGRSNQSSPTKHSGQPEMSEKSPRRTLSAGASFWREKQGPRDWNSNVFSNVAAGPSSSMRRRPVPGLVINDNNGALEDDDADWDVETAVQQRVVQVMFTVPKEKLRVVNADALSLLSSNRSEADHEEDREREQLKRMSSVREGDENYEYNDDDTAASGKGKGRAA